MKGRGLSKLKFFCQMCNKQCRDSNGFKCHVKSDSHRAQMKIFAENPEKYIEEFSGQFEDQFMSQLSDEEGWQVANEVYSAIVRDKDHVHMNATKWTTLTEFLEYLESKGVVRLRPDPARPKSFEIQQIDLEKEQNLERTIMDEKRKVEKMRIREEADAAKRLKVMREGYTLQEQVTVTAPTGIVRTSPDAKVQLKLGGRSGAEKIRDDGDRVALFDEEFVDVHVVQPTAVPDSTVDHHLSTRQSASTQKLQHWLGCVVKIVSGEFTGAKGVVDAIDRDILILQLLKSDNTASVTVAGIETVIPNLNRKVRVVNGPMQGKDGMLLSVDTDRGIATVFFSSLDECHDLKFDDICKLQE